MIIDLLPETSYTRHVELVVNWYGIGLYLYHNTDQPFGAIVLTRGGFDKIRFDMETDNADT